MLLLGAKPLRAFVDGKAKLGASRGLWAQTTDAREYFTARDPSQLWTIVDPASRESRLGEFVADVTRMSDRLLGREPDSPFTVHVFSSPVEAHRAGFLTELARRTERWTFDIETYDGAKFPSRKNVSTDPCHPDFRLRGIAVATSDTEGVFIECLGWEERIAEARAVLSPAFSSPAPKGAFSGHFDDEGLVYPGWVDAVVNRTDDGMLGLLALSDGAHDTLRLEHAVVNVLGARQYWNGMDKSKMRDAPLSFVAASAVGDACYEHQLIGVVRGRLARGEYFMHGGRQGLNV